MGATPTDAVRCFAAAEILRASIGAVPPTAPSTGCDATGAIAAVEAALGQATFTTAWAASVAVPTDDVVLEVLAMAPPGRRHRPTTARPSRDDRLTARELQVLRFLAAGRSNREIAAELVVSARTAEHHIASIYAKIGAHRRADAVTYALRHGLVPADSGA